MLKKGNSFFGVKGLRLLKEFCEGFFGSSMVEDTNGEFKAPKRFSLPVHGSSSWWLRAKYSWRNPRAIESREGFSLEGLRRACIGEDRESNSDPETLNRNRRVD